MLPINSGQTSIFSIGPLIGAFERTEQGGLICPFGSMHIDMSSETT